MKLKLIINEGDSNQFEIYKQPTAEFIGTFEFNSGDELDLEVSEGFDLQAIRIDDSDLLTIPYFQFQSGSI